MPHATMVPARTLLLACAAALPAAELVVRDLEVSASALPTAYDFKLKSATLNRQGTDGFNSGTEFSVGARWSLTSPGDRIGLVLGGDVGAQAWTASTAGRQTTLGDGFGRAAVGLGYAVSDEWRMRLEAGARYGMATFDQAASASSPQLTADGTMTGYDARAALQWRVAGEWWLSAHAGWMTQSYALESGARGITLDLEQAGLYVGLGLSWRLWSAPEVLE